jgi:hypothetical protein
MANIIQVIDMILLCPSVANKAEKNQEINQSTLIKTHEWTLKIESFINLPIFMMVLNPITLTKS